MTTRVKVSSRYQTAVPAAARKRLGTERGDHLLVEARDGHVVLVPEPRYYVARWRGLHSKIWKGADPREHVGGERAAW